MGEITDLSKRPRKAELNFLASVFANMSVVRTISKLRLLDTQNQLAFVVPNWSQLLPGKG